MDYKVYLTTKIKAESLQDNPQMLALEPEDYTQSEIKAIKEKGYMILGYLSLGTISTERPWYKQFSPYKLKRLPDWPKEYYMDLKKEPWQNFLVERAQNLKRLGFDGWWLDNLDVYSEYKSKAMFTAVMTGLQAIKAIGGYVMVNGGSEWLDDALDKKVDISKCVDGYTQEEVFSRVTSYKGKGTFGKQTAADSRFYQTLLKRVRDAGTDTFLLEYTRDPALRQTILDWCEKNGMTGCCISEDVDL